MNKKQFIVSNSEQFQIVWTMLEAPVFWVCIIPYYPNIYLDRNTIDFYLFPYSRIHNIGIWWRPITIFLNYAAAPTSYFYNIYADVFKIF